MVDRERPDDVDALAERQRASDDLLRELVGDDRRRRDEPRIEPLGSARPRASARPRRSAGARSRWSRRGRRLPADRSRGRARVTPRLSSCALVVDAGVAYGTASSRSSAIGFPQTRRGRRCRSRCGRAPPRSRRGGGRRSPRAPRRARAGTSRSRCRRGGRRSRSRGRRSPRASEPSWCTALRAAEAAALVLELACGSDRDPGRRSPARRITTPQPATLRIPAVRDLADPRSGA